MGKFRMKGFTYPGTSPIRNLKDDPSQMDNPESSYHDSDKHQEIQDKISADEKAIAAAEKKATNKANWGKVGDAVLESAATAAIQGGMNLLFSSLGPKQKPKRARGALSGFSQVKIGS